MAKETPGESDIEAQLMTLLVARVQAEHEQLIRDLTSAVTQEALDTLLRAVADQARREWLRTYT